MNVCSTVHYSDIKFTLKSHREWICMLKQISTFTVYYCLFALYCYSVLVLLTIQCYCFFDLTIRHLPRIVVSYCACSLSDVFTAVIIRSMFVNNFTFGVRFYLLSYLHVSSKYAGVFECCVVLVDVDYSSSVLVVSCKSSNVLCVHSCIVH